VTALRNINKKSGLLSGTRLQITDLHKSMFKGAVITTGEFYGKEVIARVLSFHFVKLSYRLG
jgi:hypothetical protein